MCTGQGIDLKKQRERQAHHGNPRNSHFYSEACLKALCSAEGKKNTSPLRRGENFIRAPQCETGIYAFKCGV